MSFQTLLRQPGDFHPFNVSTGWKSPHLWTKKKLSRCVYEGGHSCKNGPLLCHRALSVQKAPLLQSRVLKGHTVLVEVWVKGLSAPRVAEAGIAVAWASRSLLEAARSDSTADGEPRLQYANDSAL